MKQRNLFIILGSLVAVGLSSALMMSCKNKPMTGMIILTQVSEKNLTADYITGESWRYISRARLVALVPDKPGKPMSILSDGFYSACSPEISYDGKTMLFAGQRKEGDTWQIWEMDLGNSKLRQVTSSEESCVDPVYLPGNRFAYSSILANDSLKAGYSLYTGNIDGSNMQRITFNPNAYFASGVLQDGRILAISRQLYPAPENPFWIVIRPDGTKADLFYKGAENTRLCGRACQATNNQIVFIESDSGKQESGNLIAVSYTRPLSSRVNLSAGIEGDFKAVFPRSSGKYLVSYRKSTADRYALYEFDPEKKVLSQVVYAAADYDVLDVVVVEERIRPKKLPSEVDMGVKTGLLLCQDINILDPQFRFNTMLNKKATRIELLGLNSSLGTVTVEEDGSFYLKAMADTPFRIQTLDENGKIVNGPCSWIWLRPNERRGCIGCHEDHELAPENNVPYSVRKDPVIIPVHITEVTEKEVELE
jgi:hypothetical protein